MRCLVRAIRWMHHRQTDIRSQGGKNWVTVWVALLAMQVVAGFGVVSVQAEEGYTADPFERVDPGIRVEPVSRTVVNLMSVASHEAVTATAEPTPYLPDPDLLPAPPEIVKALENGVPSLEPSSPGLPDPPSAPALSVSFEALPDNGLAIPPDTNGAVGPNHLMVPLNSQVRIQTRAGAVVSTVPLTSFWFSLGTIDVFDPKVIYDPDSGRFLFVTCAQRRSAASSMLLGVSASSDPTGTWYLWQLDGDAGDTNWVDYPNLGVNGTWITFTANMYTISGDSFAGVNIWAVDKASALDGGSMTSTLFFETGVGGTHVPCLTFSAAEPTQYLVSRWNSALGLLRLYTITGSAASPVWTATSLYPSSSAWNGALPEAPQFGSSETIDTNDSRIMNAVLRNGSLWCTHAVGMPASGATRTAAKWWEIDPTTGTSIQSGVVEDTVDGMFYYFPTIAVNANDEVLLGFSGSSSSMYAGGYYTYRESVTPAGTMQAVSLLKAGEAPYYKTFTGTRNRWGDYSATCVDPVDDVSLWTIQEYADAPQNKWGTWWGMLGSTSCTDGDADGYGYPASASCTYPEEDCDDTDPDVNPGMTEVPGNGVDDDCNPTTPAYPEPANTMALSYGESSLLSSGVFNELALVLLPAGAVFLFRARRREKKEKR